MVQNGTALGLMYSSNADFMGLKLLFRHKPWAEWQRLIKVTYFNFIHSHQSAAEDPHYCFAQKLNEPQLQMDFSLDICEDPMRRFLSQISKVGRLL